MEMPLRHSLVFVPAALLLALSVRADVLAPSPVSPAVLEALERDDAAAEKALAAGNVAGAMKYFDYFGHEQEDFARATLEYRLARQKLADAVRDTLGRRAWGRAARLLGVPRHGRGPGKPERAVRRDGAVLYVKNAGAAYEVPYVNTDGAWKVSVREVLVIALRSRFGEAVRFEEADLYVLAGKTGKVLRDRAGKLSALTEAVRARRVASQEQLHDEIDRIRRGDAAP
jgi:hypothetical protein